MESYVWYTELVKTMIRMIYSLFWMRKRVIYHLERTETIVHDGDNKKTYESIDNSFHPCLVFTLVNVFSSGAGSNCNNYSRK